MIKKHIMLLTLATLLCNAQLVATDIVMVNEMPSDDEMTEMDTRGGCCKCKRYPCLIVTGNTQTGTLTVNGNGTIGGALSVTGPVSASSFVTPTGALFNGLRNYAVLANQSALASGSPVQWAATSASNLSAGITFSPVTGTITLPTSGIFLVQYTVRFEITSNAAPSTATVQLFQGGVAITQPAIFQNLAPADSVAPETLMTGYALVTVTSAANNTLNLVTTFNNGFSVAGVSEPDANAQMTILQLN